MRFLYWLYALAAFGLCVFLFLHVRRADTADPRALLEQARARMTGPDLDLLSAGHDLDAALAAAERSADRPLVEEILIQRARLSRQTNAYTRAKSDLEQVLTHHRPNSPAIESMLSAVMLDSGDVEGALARADAVLARDRNQAEAWGVRAEALLTLADRIVEDCVERAGVIVASSGLADTERLMRRIAARPIDDAARLRLTQQLHATFPDSEQQLSREIRVRLDDASALLAQAPEALAASFRGGLRPTALVAYVQTLYHSGESDAATDLGMAALSFQPFRVHGPLLMLMLEMLHETGRSEAAAELIDPRLVRNVALDSQFYLAWASALMATENWSLLAVAGNQLRATGIPELRPVGDFYIALGMAKRGRFEEAGPMLRRFLQSGAEPPFEGATALAWFALADEARQKQNFDEEAAALQRGLKAATLATSGQGPAWLRLAEIELGKAQPNRGLALDALTQALRRMPERRADIEPRWRELGELIAKGRKLDFERDADALERLGLLTPVERRVPFEYVRIAEVQLERGHYASALALALRALEQHDGLAPALDLAVEAALGAEAWLEAARLVRARIAVEGSTPENVAALASIPPEVLGPHWRRELVRLDPRGIGRRWAAEELRERGELQQAIASVERIAVARRSDADHILLAELLDESGRPDLAQVHLSRLSADVRVLGEAAPLMLSIAARQRDPQHAKSVLELLEARIPLDPDAAIDAVDELMMNGLVHEARKACELLDARQRWRSPRMHLRMAQAAMLQGDSVAANEALERALAYDDSGSVELGFLIAAAVERRFPDAPVLRANVLQSSLEATPFQFVALAALGEQLREARVVLDSAIAQRRAESGEGPDAPLSAIESLLDSALRAMTNAADPKLDPITAQHGFGALPSDVVQRDPRPLLARIAALDDPEWTAWAVADLGRELPPRKGALWPTYLAARGAAWLGSHALAERLGRSAASAWPSFAPAWDVVESVLLEQHRSYEHPKLVQLAGERRKSLPAGRAEALEGALLDARLLRAKGDLKAATVRIDAAYALAPTRVDVLAERARIARASKRWAAAIEAHHEWLSRARDQADPRDVRAFVELLAEARKAQGAAMDALVRREFDFLTESQPDDALVKLEAVRFAFPLGPDTDRLVAEHAVSELEHFRSRVGGGLDRRHHGVSLRWADYFARLDPERALRLTVAELDHAPEYGELWRKRGELELELRRFDEAIESFEVALGIAPSQQAVRSLVDARARRGDPEAELRELIERDASLVGMNAGDRGLQLAVARSLVRAERASLTRGIAVLGQLWATRDPAAREDEMIEIGLLYGAALCRRASAGDANTAFEALAQITPRVRDPLQASLAVTLRQLAATLRGRG